MKPRSPSSPAGVSGICRAGNGYNIGQPRTIGLTVRQSFGAPVSHAAPPPVAAPPPPPPPPAVEQQAPPPAPPPPPATAPERG